MTSPSLTFDAVAEARPSAKWRARWDRSWPAYEAWFLARNGDDGPSRDECQAALARHMPELLPVHRKLTRISGGGDRAARFLSTWCPPPYLGGCSVAARAAGGTVRLVRNYDLSPDLNEGLLLRTEWTGMPAMGMVEFLWGLSDGINAAGLAVALAFGGRSETARGFGIATILRYVLETCSSVGEALAVLRRVPSHMAYNVVLADRSGATAAVELAPGGGARLMPRALTTNHQHGRETTARSGFTRTADRHAHLEKLFAERVAPDALGGLFLKPPLHQQNYAEGFGTLFTAVYDPVGRLLTLRWPGRDWSQRLESFVERQVHVHFAVPVPTDRTTSPTTPAAVAAWLRPYMCPAAQIALKDWAEAADETPDWARLGDAFADAAWIGRAGDASICFGGRSAG